MGKTGGGKGTNQYVVKGTSKVSRQDVSVVDGLESDNGYNSCVPPENPLNRAAAAYRENPTHANRVKLDKETHALSDAFCRRLSTEFTERTS